MVYVYQQYVYQFMVLQIVLLWSYMSYKFCVVIYLSTKIYKKKGKKYIGGWGGLTNTLCKFDLNVRFDMCKISTIIV